MAGWLAGFGQFWYRFIVGDDWLLAAAVALGLVADYAALRAGYRLWWLLPIVVVAAMALSLWRARGTPP
jgi:hydrogenase/urease accessory protein HupE